MGPKDLRAEAEVEVEDPVDGDKNQDVAHIDGEEEDGAYGFIKPRKKEFGFLPIPKSKRHDPTLKVHEQFEFTWKMNLILAGAAVSSASWSGEASVEIGRPDV
jgi:hypothetical protein